MLSQLGSEVQMAFATDVNCQVSIVKLLHAITLNINMSGIYTGSIVPMGTIFDRGNIKLSGH